MLSLPLAAISLPSTRLLLLGGAAAILYIVGRLLMSAIPRRIDGSSLRSMLGAITVLIVSCTAVIMQRPQVGLHLPIAAAAGAMSFGIASILIARGVPTNPQNVGFRSWALVLPAVALVFVGGLGGRADFQFLAFLLAYGVIALSAWLPDRTLARPAAADESQTVAPGTFGETLVGTVQMPAMPVASPEPHATGARAAGSHAFALLVWLGSVLLAGLAGVMAIYGMPALESLRHVPADALVTVFLLAPSIVVPIVFELLPPCRPIGWTASVSTLAKFALMCLCLVLPVVVLVTADVQVIRDWLNLRDATALAANPAANPATVPAGSPTTLPTVANPSASSQPIDLSLPRLTFPSLPQLALSTDLLVLAASSLLVLPIAGGWLRPGKLEAAALFLCYVVNLALLIVGMIG